jgi:hypothetical protein
MKELPCKKCPDRKECGKEVNEELGSQVFSSELEMYGEDEMFIEMMKLMCDEVKNFIPYTTGPIYSDFQETEFRKPQDCKISDYEWDERINSLFDEYSEELNH